jgi:hypothetical protein
VDDVEYNDKIHTNKVTFCARAIDSRYLRLMGTDGNIRYEINAPEIHLFILSVSAA